MQKKMDKMSKHTEGSWYASENIIYKDIGNRRHEIATLQSWSEETEANAALIAAAPEMLGWLKAVVRQMEYELPHTTHTNGESGLFGMRANLEKIIAKAEGRE